MAKILLNLSDELKAKLQAKAKKSNRNTTQHLIHIIERDLDMVEISIVGKIKDGVISIEEELARR